MIKIIYYNLRYDLPLNLFLKFSYILPDNRFSVRFRGFISSFFIKDCGKNLTIGSDVTILNSYNLIIGNNVYLAKGGWYNALGRLTIEDDVVCGPYVVISTLRHLFYNNSVRHGGTEFDPVVVGNGSWLASHVSVTSGTIIGKGNLIASNSAVTKSTDDNGIYGGVPAKFISKNVNKKASFYSSIDILNSMDET